jgi:hypothetical protein
MNRRIIILTCILVCLVAALLVGCAATKPIVPMANGPISAGNARIEMTRSTGSHAYAVAIDILDSGKNIGSIGPDGMLVWDRPAGPMILNANVPSGTERMQAKPFQIGVGAGMTYKFRVYFPPFIEHWKPVIELVSGTAVAFEQSGTNTSTVKAEQVQQPQAQAGETKIIKGTIESFPHGFQFKSGPPLWPAGMIVVAADNGEKSNILIVGSGTSATIFYDADGTARGNLADGNARVTVGKKVEVKYVSAPANYATKALAVSVRYLAETLTASEGAPRADSASAQTSASASVPMETGETIGGKFKIVEVKHFTQSEGLGLSQEFINYFYDGLRERLKKEQVANQIVDEGAAVPDAEAANTMIVEGKFTEYKKGGFLEGVGIVGSEIKLYRRSDHKLIATINPRVPFKPSPLNTDSGVGKNTGSRTADEIKKALK